jgi:uncharacterized protein
MTRLEQIQRVLGRKRLAFVGVSRNSRDFTRTLFREFVSRGYDVVPVHPGAAEVDGRACFARLQDIDPPVEAALLVTSPSVTEQIVQDCAEAGVMQVWMYRAGGEGAVSSKAVEFCRSHGIGVVPGECPMMFFPQSGFVHRLHGLIRKMTGRYPR